MVGFDVRVHDLVIGTVWDFGHRTVERIHTGVAYKDLDSAEFASGLLDEIL